MLLDLATFLTVSTILFLLGLSGIILNRRNIIIVLMSIELILLAVNLNFIVYSVYLDDLMGQVFALFILTVAAAESAIGLAILVVYYRVRGSIAMETINLMHGLGVPLSVFPSFLRKWWRSVSRKVRPFGRKERGKGTRREVDLREPFLQ